MPTVALAWSAGHTNCLSLPLRQALWRYIDSKACSLFNQFGIQTRRRLPWSQSLGETCVHVQVSIPIHVLLKFVRITQVLNLGASLGEGGPMTR